MTIISENKMFDGTQRVYSQASKACQCEMRFAVFLPPQIKQGPCPALVWLSGLTCNDQNFTTKAGAQKYAAELGMILVMPDTSPRGDDVPDDDGYDFGKGAGFYLNATEKPWAQHFQMETYIRDELTAWMAENLPVDMNRIGIFGHSMGGHGALTLHLKNPDLFKTCSAFSPIVAPSQVPWGRKALGRYLGEDQKAWAANDATQLVSKSASQAHILIDQGLGDEFLEEHLKPELFEAACVTSGQKLSLHLRGGYDHSYYFIASYIESHLRHHAKYL